MFAACPGCVTSLATSLLHQPGCSKLPRDPQRSLGWEHLPILGSSIQGLGPLSLGFLARDYCPGGLWS